MSKAKKEVKELTKIAGILTELRNHEDEAEELAEELEGIVVTDKGTKYLNFCKAYVIVVIREFCSTDDDAELMLAAYGLLKGFEFKPKGLTERLTAYWKHSRDYNKLLENIKTESSVPKTVSDNMKRIIEGLDKKITAGLSTGKGKLGLLDKVPNKLELPEPRKRKDEPLFPDKSSGNNTNQTPKENTLPKLPKPPQKPDKKREPTVIFIYSKVEKIIIPITAGALAIICIFLIWMSVAKDNRDPIADIPNAESANSSLENQGSSAESIDNSKESQDGGNGNASGSDESEELYDELMSNVQNRIVNIDEPEKYNVEMAYEAIMVAIINNPVIGDMAARGLRDLELYGMDQTLGDLAPWLDEFIEETDKAMELPLNQHPRGMERWLVYKKGAGNEASLSDEYFVYAGSICHFLDSSTIIGVREWESVENWHLVREDVVNSSRRAERNPEQVTHQALVFQVTDTRGNVLALFGFSTLDLRFIVYDPSRDYE